MVNTKDFKHFSFEVLTQIQTGKAAGRGPKLELLQLVESIDHLLEY